MTLRDNQSSTKLLRTTIIAAIIIRPRHCLAILIAAHFLPRLPRYRRMNKEADEPPPEPKAEPAPKPRKAWPMEEALATIEAYAADLREWVRKLRGRLH